MALNFPPVDSNDGNPTDGMIWTAPNGRQWIYDAAIPGWRSVAPTGNSNIIYRGGIDLTQSPSSQYPSIESGNQFVVTVGTDPVNQTLYPGLSGGVATGSVVMYDGNEWQAVANIPYATESTPGVVRLATYTEAYAGVNDSKALTPLTGKNLYKQATRTEIGITRYATRAEAEAGQIGNAALTPDSLTNILNNITTLVDKLVPTGMIMWWTSAGYAPPGWIRCDGRTIDSVGASADLYQHLMSVGNPWGGSGVVRIPDLRGRFIRGFNQGVDVSKFPEHDPADPPFGGYQADEFREHTHVVNDPGHSHSIEGNGYAPDVQQDSDDVLIDDNLGVARSSNTKSGKTGITLEKTGGGPETRPKSVILMPVIKL